jgi:predicted transcriptional regulator
MAQRLSVNLSDEVAKTLNELAKRRGTTVTEAVRRAISTEAFIQDQIDNGKSILIADRDHENVREIVFR